MKKIILYGLFLSVIFIACEDIYKPDIEQMENVLVIDARIEASGRDSYVRLSKSLGFNESEYGYEPVTGAKVFLISSDDKSREIYESQNGIFPVNGTLNSELNYKLKVEHESNVYESSFEPVPDIPNLDSIFATPVTRFLLPAGEKDINNAIKRVGAQLYSNILSEKEMPYYRFTARKILEYSYAVDLGTMEIMVYGWRSTFPSEVFNIAAPPEFSLTTDIVKHPLYFIEQRPHLASDHKWNGIEQAGNTNFIGWILILYQHGLSESAYNYYKDLNSQLNSEGRLFDPLYLQAGSNLRCTSNPKLLVFGNFEISRIKEHRFYVRYASEKLGYYLKPIDSFYPIPLEGESTDRPDFWEPK